MDRTGRVVARIRRRLIAAAVLDSTGSASLWASVACLLALGVLKVTGEPVPWLWLLATGWIAGLLVGIAIGLRRATTALQAAHHTDQRLRLKDRLSTATVLANAPRADVFAQLSMTEAEIASAAVDVRRAAPLALRWHWSVWPIVALGAVAIGIWVPATNVLRSRHDTRASAALRRDVAARLRDAADAVAAVDAKRPTPPNPSDPAAQRHEDLLEQLNRELATGTISPTDAAQRAAAELSRQAGEQERHAAQDREAQDALRQSLSHAARGTAESDLAKALQSGDFAAAAQATKDLLNPSSADGSAEQRARAAHELEQIAKELRDAERAKQQTTADAGPTTLQPPAQSPSTSDSPPPRDSSPEADPAKSQHEPNRSSPTDRLAETLERAAKELQQEKPPDGEQTPKPAPSAPRDQSAPPTPSDAARPPEQTSKPSSAKSSSPDATPQQSRPAPSRQPSTTDRDKPDQAPTNTGAEPKPAPSGATDPQQPPAPKSHETHNTNTQSQTSKDNAAPKGAPGSSPVATPTQRPESQESTRRPAEQPAPDGSARKQTPTNSNASPRQTSTQPDGSSDKSSSSPKTSDEHPAGEQPAQPSGAPRGEQTQEPGPPPSRSSDKPASSPPRDSEAQHPASAREDAQQAHGSGQSPPPTGSPSAAPNPASAPSNEPRDDGAHEPSNPASGPPNLDRLAKELQQLASAPKDAAARERQAQDLRRRAEEMLRNASPEQRQEAQKWANEHPEELERARRQLEQAGLTPPGSPSKSSGGGPEGVGHSAQPREASPDGTPRTAPIDARRQREAPTRERVIAEWYSDAPSASGASAPGGTLTPGTQESLRQAARTVERAVDDQQVPSRFDKLLLRYFKRLPERAQSPGDPVTPPAPPTAPSAPAKDAP